MIERLPIQTILTDMSSDTIQRIATVFLVDPEAMKPAPKVRRQASIIREFSLHTSTHGIPGIARSQSIKNRMFWIISFLIYTGIMIYFIVQAIRAYFEYPSQTSVSVIVEWPQAFPAVTICNYSPLRYGLFINPFFDYLKAFNLSNTMDPANFTYEQSLYVWDFLIYKLNQNESLYEYFYSLDSMLIACNYNGIPCTATNFTWFITASYGLCYTFNAKLKDADNNGIRYNADNGGNGVFDIRLYTHQHQYVPYVAYGKCHITREISSTFKIQLVEWW